MYIYIYVLDDHKPRKKEKKKKSVCVCEYKYMDARHKGLSKHKYLYACQQLIINLRQKLLVSDQVG